ncbi:hypothetical protein TorRG33x02_182850 [Trema orientale]|uniref:Uncharacterized protein n=1 Tax=Trema orientale TaxID=63057 RepID=A0A2P5EK99_TREOI|nr:hypothetical protein TorRG33x02_182850 [Trema orientale]
MDHSGLRVKIGLWVRCYSPKWVVRVGFESTRFRAECLGWLGESGSRFTAKSLGRCEELSAVIGLSESARCTRTKRIETRFGKSNSVR